MRWSKPSRRINYFFLTRRPIRFFFFFFFFYFEVFGIQLGIILLSWEERRNHFFHNLKTTARAVKKKREVETFAAPNANASEKWWPSTFQQSLKLPTRDPARKTDAGGYIAELTITRNPSVDLRGQTQNRSGLLHTQKWKHLLWAV